MKEKLIEQLITLGYTEEELKGMTITQLKAELADNEATEPTAPVPAENGTTYGRVQTVVARKGGLAGYEESVGSWTDSGHVLIDDVKTRVTKSGQNKGREYFVAKSLVKGEKNACFSLAEAAALQLEYDNLSIVRGDWSKNAEGEDVFSGQLVKGTGITLQKSDSVLKMIG